MVARTFYPEREPTFADTSCGCADRLHGWTADRIHAAAHVATRELAAWSAVDRDTMLATAWDGVVDYLLGQEHPDHFSRVVWAGKRAIQASATTSARQHGHRYEHGPGVLAPRWVMYWVTPLLDPTATETAQDRLVERAAVHQVVAALSERDRRVLEAFAVTLNRAAAAELLGVTRATAGRWHHAARQAFLSLWFDDETPAPLEPGSYLFHTQGPIRQRARCGTPGGHQRHRRNREEPCRACKDAVNEYGREYRASRAAS